MTSLRVLHLYPRQLGINGDVGNVMALVQRVRWVGVSATVWDYEPGGELPDAVDVVHIGSGPLSAQRAVHADVLRIGEQLRRWHDQQIPILAISGGWQLLGRSLTTPDGQILEGAAVFPSHAVLGTGRRVGEILVRTPDGQVLAGCENHAATTTLEGGEALGHVVAGYGNDGSDEGIRVAESVGTHLHGALLPMNPLVADRILASALGEKEFPESEQRNHADRYAQFAREAIAGRLKQQL